MRRAFFIAVLSTVMTFSTGVASAQDDEDVQSWNDVQITGAMSKRMDAFVKFTGRFGKDITRLNDGRIAFGFVWKPTKALSISPYYWYVRARNSAGRFRTENRLAVSATYKFPTKGFGLSHRSTYEYRSRRPVSWRYRAMLTFDKDLPKSWIKGAKWYVSEEVFYDSATRKFSRNRFSVGLTKTFSKMLSWDLYYMRQNDGFSHPGDLNIIGQSWKLKF